MGEMKSHMDSRIYTNVMLTVIAVMLVALGMKVYDVSFANTAQAQQPASAFKTSTTTPGVDSNVAQSQDLAVAAATQSVATSNREIANAINGVAKSLLEVAEAIREAGKKGGVVGAPVSTTAPADAGIEMSTTGDKK